MSHAESVGTDILEEARRQAALPGVREMMELYSRWAAANTVYVQQIDASTASTMSVSVSSVPMRPPR